MDVHDSEHVFTLCGSLRDGSHTRDALCDRVQTLGTDLVAYAGVESSPEPTTAPTAPTAD